MLWSMPKFELPKLPNLNIREKAEKLAKAPIKKQLSVWVESFELPILALENETALSIKNKFEAFKNWANKEIENL